jgi:two-component system, cell cycle response regulator DivK
LNPDPDKLALRVFPAGGVMIQNVLLIVDDEEDNRVIFSAILTHHDYAVVLAKNGQEAVELARDHSPRLILMDLQMPVADGWEATLQLKADPETADIPVIAVTAGDHPAARLEEAGFCAYVRKPVAPQDLLRAVEFCLERVGEGMPWIELPSFDVAPPAT